MSCNCEYCKHNLPFNLPKEIVDATIDRKLVVFAGAGISTENSAVFDKTFYEEIFLDLRLPKDTIIDFPSLMTLFCDQANGRRLLLSKIKKRFDYATKYYELYRVASWFHNELSSIYQIDKIITTNWDDYFEKECGAIPIVSAEDFAFYNIPERKVFKIHGSISNYGSIIATSNDYKRCYQSLKNGLVGAHLKNVLATNVVLFVGFSFRDYDFNKIYEYLKKEMGSVIPHIYVVTIDDNLSDKFDKKKVTVIKTDGKYFFSTLREHLEGTKALLPKAHFDSLFEIRETLKINKSCLIEHFYKNKRPVHIYNIFYQDGIRHALDCLYFFSSSGRSFDPQFVIDTIETYKGIKKEMTAKKRYSTLAYVEGYLNTFIEYFIKTKPSKFLYFYIIGFGPIESFNEYKKLTSKNQSYHKSADKVGFKLYKDFLTVNSNEIPKHKPFIW